jgi:hypothetical protein
MFYDQNVGLWSYNVKSIYWFHEYIFILKSFKNFAISISDLQAFFIGLHFLKYEFMTDIRKPYPSSEIAKFSILVVSGQTICVPAQD